jgi:voltage-dependent calcium channel
MISGESEVDQRPMHHRSRSHADEERRRTQHLSSMGLPTDTSYPSQVYPSPAEKAGTTEYPFPDMGLPPGPAIPIDMINPLRGKSLGIFSPENAVRRGLCNLLVHPWTEPLILVLIVLQTVLLAVEAAPNVFLPGNERPARWGSTKTDWALFSLFVVFTLEIIARIIVSGFVLNAAEYSTIDRQRGIKAAVADQYRAIFQPQRQKSVKGARQPRLEPSAFARSFTIMQRQTKTVEEQQRFQLARRAFLRHGFNRLDFVAVVSFWISFVLGINGIEKQYHIYIFKMLSCLRILRLLALTSGTAIILRSLKKAAPLLVRVAFLMSFFWLLFAIIGVQSFKASLSRQCLAGSARPRQQSSLVHQLVYLLRGPAQQRYRP